MDLRPILDENRLRAKISYHLNSGTELCYDDLVAHVQLDRMLWHNRNSFFNILQRLTRLVDGRLERSIPSIVGVRGTEGVLNEVRKHCIPYGNLVYEMRWLGRPCDKVTLADVENYRLRRRAVNHFKTPTPHALDPQFGVRAQRIPQTQTFPTPDSATFN